MPAKNSGTTSSSTSGASSSSTPSTHAANMKSDMDKMGAALGMELQEKLSKTLQVAMEAQNDSLANTLKLLTGHFGKIESNLHEVKRNQEANDVTNLARQLLRNPKNNRILTWLNVLKLAMEHDQQYDLENPLAPQLLQLLIEALTEMDKALDWKENIKKLKKRVKTLMPKTTPLGAAVLKVLKSADSWDSSEARKSTPSKKRKSWGTPQFQQGPPPAYYQPQAAPPSPWYTPAPPAPLLGAPAPPAAPKVPVQTQQDAEGNYYHNKKPCKWCTGAGTISPKCKMLIKLSE